MTTQLTARPNRPGQPSELHVQIDQWMTQEAFKVLAGRINQRFNDLRHERSEPFRHESTPGYFEYPTFEESANFDPVGIDSEGGSCD